ncbi:MAG: BamA/TamA family outer membrane protein [Candidatus Krumholzibacteriia bacterium]
MHQRPPASRRLAATAAIALAATTLWLASGAVCPAAAQMFGKNKVQVKPLRWQVLVTPHFDLHFYDGAEELAVRASLIAEQAYEEYAARLGRDLPWRVPFVLYASHQDFAQTNISPYLIGEGTGGFTEPLRNRMVLPYNGSHADFVHVIRHELVHAFMFDMAYGGGSEPAQRRFYQVPLWFAEGIAEWFSSGWDAEADMFLRDATINDYLWPLDRVGGFLVYKEGQAAMRLLSERYGHEKLLAFWRQVGRRRDAERALLDVYGLDMESFNELFAREMRRRYWPQYADLEQPEDIARPLTDHRVEQAFYNGQPALSPDGDELVYFSDRDGLVDLYLASAIDGRVIRQLGRSQRSSRFESFHSFRSGLSWAPDGDEVALVAKTGNDETLHTISTRTGEVTRSLRLGFDVLASPAWSPDGEAIVVAGTRFGRTDLYLVDLSGRAAARFEAHFPAVERGPDGVQVVRLTDTIGDEAQPVWSPAGDRLAFTFNPLAEIEFEFEVLPDGRKQLLWARPLGESHSGGRRLASDVAVQVLDLTTGERHELFDVNAGRSNPVWLGERDLAMVESTGGIANLAIVRLDGTGTRPVSSRRLTNVLGGIDQLSYSRRSDRLVFAGFHAAGYDLYAADAFLAGWSQRVPGGRPPAAPVLEPPPLVERTEPPQPLTDPERVGMVETYRPGWQVDLSEALAGGGVYFTSAGGLGLANWITLSDLMGDRKLRFLVNFFGSFENSDVAASYHNLKRRLDWGAGVFHYNNFYHSVLTTVGELLPDDTSFKERNYGFFTHASYPLNTFERFDLELQFLTSERTVYEWTTDFLLVETDRRTSRLVQPTLAYIHDTALYGSHGPLTGSRWYAAVSRSIPVADDSLDRWTAVLDYRKYWMPWRRNSFAVHLNLATSAGDNPRAWVLGGPWTLRGYDFYDYQTVSNLAGSKIFLLQTEYRLPLVEALVFGWPFRWGFTDVGAAAYFDVGAAWTDRIRFFGTDAAGHWGFDELRGDVGFAIRTNVLFLPLRFDWAWPTDLRRVGGRTFHFSIGMDF